MSETTLIGMVTLLVVAGVIFVFLTFFLKGFPFLQGVRKRLWCENKQQMVDAISWPSIQTSTTLLPVRPSQLITTCLVTSIVWTRSRKGQFWRRGEPRDRTEFGTV